MSELKAVRESREPMAVAIPSNVLERGRQPVAVSPQPVQPAPAQQQPANSGGSTPPKK